MEPGNPHSPSDNAIVVKTRVEGTDKKETVVGHIPEPLAQMLGPILKDGTVHSIVAKIMHQSFETPGPPPRALAGHSLFMHVRASELPGPWGKSEW